MEKTQAQEMWPQAMFSRLMGKMSISSFVVFVFALVQIIRVGIFANDYLLLLLGSLLSVVTMLGYTIAGYIYGATGRKSYLATLLAFGGFVPWLFGSYLVFYRGFWMLTDLLNGFDIILIAKSIIFIFLGYFIVSNFYKITELDKKFAKQTKDEGWTRARGTSK